MGKVRLGRDVASKLVEAMGLPLDGALGVDIDLPVDGLATVHVSYMLTAEAIALLAEAMKRDAE